MTWWQWLIVGLNGYVIFNVALKNVFLTKSNALLRKHCDDLEEELAKKTIGKDFQKAWEACQKR